MQQQINRRITDKQTDTFVYVCKDKPKEWNTEYQPIPIGIVGSIRITQRSNAAGTKIKQANNQTPYRSSVRIKPNREPTQIHRNK